MSNNEMEKIDRLVEAWNEEEVARQIEEHGFCDTTDPLDDLDPANPEHKKLWAAAAKKMRISVKKLTAWHEQSHQEARTWDQ